MTLALPEDKMVNIINQRNSFINNPQVTLQQLAQLIGKLSFTAQAVLPGGLNHRFLQEQEIRELRQKPYSAVITLDENSLLELTCGGSVQ